MNVKDFDVKIPEGKDLFEIIFDHQKALIKKYHQIEERNLGYKLPDNHTDFSLDIQDRRSQQRLKDFAWRVTEELTEATECANVEDKTHYLEELIDALHFMVELTIYCGITYMDISQTTNEDGLQYAFNRAPGFGNIRELTYDVIEYLGKAMNLLKNKPWKDTHMVTDYGFFQMYILQMWERFITLLKCSGLDAESTTAFYLNKNAVNEFRIRSHY